MSEAAIAPVEAPVAPPAATDLTGVSTPPAAAEGQPKSPASGEGSEGQPSGQGAAAGEAPNGGDPATGGTPAGEEGKGAQGAPESYTAFTLPDGHNAEAPWLAEVAAHAKAQNMTQEQAQALVTLGAKQVDSLLSEFAKANAEKPVMATEHWARTWSDQTTADSEIGGDNLKDTMALATRVFQTFGTPKLGEFLGETGLAHHPELIRFMQKVGKAVSEDVLVVPAGSQQARPKRGENPAKVLYPNMN